MLAACLAGTAFGAGEPKPESEIATDRELKALLEFEEQQRAATLWSSRSRADFGADPFKILRAPIRDRWIGILRGAGGAVVLLDAKAMTQARAQASVTPTGVAYAASGELLVVGESSPEILRFRVTPDEIRPLAPLRVPGVSALRDIASLGEEWIVLDPIGHQILAVDPRQTPPAVRRLASCRGPNDLVSVDGWLVANCLLDHRVLLLDARGRTVRQIEHDGPFWSIAARRNDSHLLLAAGGVENRPLDRSDGGFGYIDSFAFLYRIELATGELVSHAAINLSSLGIVTPKWLEWLHHDPPRLRLAGYASSGLLTLTWKGSDLSEPPELARQSLPPGTSDVSGSIAANPLLDAWIQLGDEPRVVKLQSLASRSLPSRLGEALFFTTLLAPWNESDGRRSRFTCETCHHEGYVDGRTHYTGRGQTYATTKPLVGLHGNRPYFSRALDPTMARMVHNEFRVANKMNGHDPWFALPSEQLSWILTPQESAEEFSPVFLRRALMTFLMQFEHATNPTTAGRTRFDSLERAGAESFLRHCESCHSARLVSDDPASAIPFARWEENIFSTGTIVWGRDGYEKTGVVPYVHAEGARVPSLRRLHKKHPLFTNGSAVDLQNVLEGFAVGAKEREHQGEETRGRPLSRQERKALRAFLELL